MLDRFVKTTRKKTTLLIAITLGFVLSVVIFPIVLISINLVVKNGEKKSTELEMLRIENTIQAEITKALRILEDWSSWNDTYEFAKDENQEYIESNLLDETISNLDLNIILILDSENKLIYQKYFDLTTQTSTDFPIDIADFLRIYPELTSSETTPGITGLVVYQERVMLVVSNPILTSVSEGPSRGTMIFVKFFDEHVLDELSQMMLKKIYIYPIGGLTGNDPHIPEPSKMSDDIYVFPQDLNTIIGYKYVSDIRGNPTLILKVENSRDLYLQGRTTKSIVSWVLIILILILSIAAYPFSGAVLYALDRRKEEETAAVLLEKSRQNAIDLEKKVFDRTKELELRNKDLATFNYTISHDLKSPLRGISGYSTLLLSEHSTQLDEKGMMYLQNLVKTTERMNRLIEDLLLYTKTEQRQIIKMDVDLGSLFDNLLTEYKDELKSRNISIKRDLEVENICTDRDGLALILSNLLDNAIKFTQNSCSPEILLKSRVSQKNIIISVTDNGIGFELKFHDKIFDIFQRLHLAEEYQGTGIGLALVKKTVERLGGNVYAQSETGIGSTFFIEIPQE